MTYAPYDPALADWARRHSLHIAIEYEDCEVRSTPARRDTSQVGVAAVLPETLEAVYRTVEQWIHDDGHTRTPVL